VPTPVCDRVGPGIPPKPLCQGQSGENETDVHDMDLSTAGKNRPNGPGRRVVRVSVESQDVFRRRRRPHVVRLFLHLHRHQHVLL